MKIGNLIGPAATSIFTPPGLHAANLTAVTALVSGTTHFLYVGKAPAGMLTMTLRWNVVTAMITPIWAEIALFRGVPVVGGNTTATRLGWTDVSTLFITTGRKTVSILATGVAPGDDLWVAYGSQATTPFQLRGMLADTNQSGVFCTAVIRSSLASPGQPITLASTTLVPAWVTGKV